jgi:hypothetical protein
VSTIDPDIADQCNRAAAVAVKDDQVAPLVSNLSQANNELVADMFASSAYTDVVVAWSKCMRKAGFDYRRPEAAVQAGMDVRGTGDVPAPAAIALAVADFKCRDNAAYFQRLHEEMAKRVHQWSEEHPEALSDLKTALDAQVAAAKVILEGS